MKYSKDTYRLYEGEGLLVISMRLVVKLKDEVDPEVLSRSVNEAIKRYPYLSVQVTVDGDGGFVLVPNERDVVVLPVADKPRRLGSKEVNYHLCFVEYEGDTLYFVISHSICGGKGAQPWVMTNVYQYIKDRYNVEPSAPGIRKPGEAFLEGEIGEPTLEMLSDEAPLYESKSKKPVMMLSDYLNGLINPFKRDPNYITFTIAQKDIIDFTKDHDASIVSFFIVAIAKMLDKVLPDKHTIIGAETSHNPSEDIGLPYAHSDMHSMIYIDYEREQLKWDMKKLGTMTRGQILLQKDPSISHKEIAKVLHLYDEMDSIKGLKNKKAYIKKHAPTRGKDARHSTFVCNYTGNADWGELTEYIEGYEAIVEGHLVFEVTSLGDKIILSMMQLIQTDKYYKSLQGVFDELGIPYVMKGPFPKHLSKHSLPKH